jgi:hypothetical protein
MNSPTLFLSKLFCYYILLLFHANFTTIKFYIKPDELWTGIVFNLQVSVRRTAIFIYNINPPNP